MGQHTGSATNLVPTNSGSTGDVAPAYLNHSGGASGGDRGDRGMGNNSHSGRDYGRCVVVTIGGIGDIGIGIGVGDINIGICGIGDVVI